MIKNEILQALQESGGAVVSGGDLAAKLHVSRTAVWKQMVSLQNEGYRIQSVANKGYRLTESDVFSAHEIERRLTSTTIGHPIVFLDTVNSTNLYAKTLAANGAAGGTTVVAASQSMGRGRFSRVFSSPDGGVYLTILLRPKLQLADINCVTLMAAVVVVDTVEELTGRRPSIKWTNDVYFDRKKLCGILTECAVEGESGMVEYVAVGIGTNLRQQQEDFSEEIRNTATSILAATDTLVDRAEYTALLLSNFEKYFCDQNFPQNKKSFLETYRNDLFFLGQTVEVSGMTERYTATALDINDEGHLLVRTESGEIRMLNSGEISIKPIES